jgi:putative ABC transport system permease protein
VREQPRRRRILRFWGPDLEADIDEELRFHLEMRERDFLARGLPPAAAREEALARFGDPEKVRRWLRRHDTRRQRRHRRSEIMSELIQDVRYGLRRLSQSPGFTLAVVLVLGLGIGATTAIFSVLDAALLRSLPYADPERLVAMLDLQGQDPVPASFPEVGDWGRNTEVFSGVAAYFPTSFTLTGSGEPEALSGIQMSGDMPRLLGVVPRVGRAFLPGEDARSAQRVVMLSEALWRRRFASDPHVLGRAVTLNGEPSTVIGIIPAGPRSTVPLFLALGRGVDFWVPLRLNEEVAPRGLHFLNVIGKLRPGIGLAQARERTAAFAGRLQETGVTDHGIMLRNLAETVIGDSRPLLLSLAGAVGMVLLIACTNIANLLLARAAMRRREIAVRLALGATRGRVLRQLLVESVLLAVLGGLAGIFVALGSLAGLRILGAFAALPRLNEAGMDARVLGFGLALSVVTGLLFGMVPAFRASRGDLAEVLKAGARGSAGGPASDRLRAGLIIAEVALSFALLVGAGLLIRSLDRLLNVDKGFRAEGVASAYLDLPRTSYAEKSRQAMFFRALRERLAALPGVRGAAFASSLPFGGGANGGFTIEGRTFPPDAQPAAEKRIVSPGYFEVLRTPVAAGRAFDDRDAAGAPAVVIVNQALARRYFSGESALGKRIDFGWETTGVQEIVGVVADVREHELSQPAAPAIYIPHAQRPEPGMFVLVRTTAEDPMRIVPSLRSAVSALDRSQALSDVYALEDLIAIGLAGRRLAMSLFGAFSVLALALAAMGLYAVISYSVLQRRQELGIRMALGARAGQIAQLILGQGLVLIAIGAGLGALAALWLGRFLAALVFGVGTADPTTFLGVGLVLLATSMLASLIPALRASRVDPASVLRSQ